MRDFEFYEFAGVLAPGALVLVAILLLYDPAGFLLKMQGTPLGSSGASIVLAYLVGHAIQAISDLPERGWLRMIGGWPTDWVRTGKHHLLSPLQTERLQQALDGDCSTTGIGPIDHLSATEWFVVTRQIYVSVRSAGASSRVDTFNSLYALCRGSAAAIVFTMLFAFLMRTQHHYDWRIALVGVVALLAFTRQMRQHAKSYATELFLQFIQLSGPSVPARLVTNTDGDRGQ